MSLDALAHESRWVAWRIEIRGDKPTKVPYAPQGGRAKADNPTTWGSRAEAEARAARIVNGQGGGVGIELGGLEGDTHLAGIDLDSCLSEEGALAPWAEAILSAAPTYTEVSPSGRGLKTFFYVESDDVRPFLDRIGILDSQWGCRRGVPGEDSRNHGPAVEVYLAGRFFAVTDQKWPGAPDHLAWLDSSQLNRIAELIPAPKTPGASGRVGADNSRSAVAFRKGVALRRAGKTYEEMCAELRSDPETAEWCREKGDTDGGRELHRIWEKAETGAGSSGRGKAHASGDPATAQQPRQLSIGSDVEIADRVARDFRDALGEVIFCDGDFWHHNGMHWQPIDHAVARRAVHLYDGAIYETPSEVPAAVKLSKSRIDSVLHEMGAMLARPDFFADAPTGINCASGFIAFDATGQPSILPHDRDHRCRHVLTGHWRSAEISAEDPPADSLLGRLLGGVFKGDEDEHDKRKLLAEIAGAAALGHATKLRQPKAIVLKGEKAENGKSQILDLIRGLLPASATASVTAAKFGDERFIVGLRSKLLNATDELSSSAAIASDTFKTVITGEPVSGRDVYRSAITFRPVAQHVYATNTLPTFAGGMDRGVQRRLLVVTFNRVIPVGERVERIGLRVGEEEPDLLLAWAVAGAARLIRQKGFTVPNSSALALRDWLFGADPVLAWTEARVTERDPARGGYKSGHAHGMFKEWALANGFRDSTIPAVNGFVQRLQANLTNAVVKHTRSGNWLRGFEILLQDRKDDEDTTG